MLNIKKGWKSFNDGKTLMRGQEPDHLLDSMTQRKLICLSPMTQNFETEWIPCAYLDINDSILRKDSAQVPKMRVCKTNSYQA